MRKKIAGVILVLLVLSTLMIGCQQSAQKPYTNNNNNNQTANEMTENERRVLAGRLSNLAEEVDGVKKASVIVTSIGMTQNNTTTNTMPNTSTNNTNTSTTRRTTMPANPGMTNTNTPGTTNMNTPGTTNMNTPNTGTGINNNNTNQTGLIVMAGITLEDNVNNNAAKMKTIKQTVANRMQAADARISQVLVTSDPDLIKRINDVASGLLNGKPIKSFETDIKNLGRDLQREMPAL